MTLRGFVARGIFAYLSLVPPGVTGFSSPHFHSRLQRSTTAARGTCICFGLLHKTFYQSNRSHSMKMSATEGSNGSKGRVVVVGSANQDLTAYTPICPVVGETVLGSSFETSCGGKGANQAVAAASLDIAPITMICRVGSDSFGAELLANFRRVGVQYDESRTVVQSDAAKDSAHSHTGVAPIVVDTRTGDNMIIVVPGANHALTPEDVRSAILSLAADDEKGAPSIVIVQLEIKPEVALEALRVGKEIGATTILNPAPAPEDYCLDAEFYKHADIIIPNETELRSLCRGEVSDADDEEGMAKILFSRGVSTAVIVTLGSRGAMIVSKDENGEGTHTTLVSANADLPCNSLPVVDTVGAGDSFCGALSAYLSSGLNLADAARNACGVASMSVRKRGAQSSYPTASELPDVLRVNSASTATEKHPEKPFLTFVTGNKNKLEEVRSILASGEGEIPFSLTNQKVDLPELQGDPLDIAIEKCKLAAKEVGGPVFTEDTSLCFNALNGMPGPYIKWFLENCGHDGLNDMLAGFDDKSAYAQTVVAFTTGPGQDVVTAFDGRTDGKIVRPRGLLDFGWDPIFEPREGGGKTYAEMSKDDKNAISHRGRAFAKFRDFLVAQDQEK